MSDEIVDISDIWPDDFVPMGRPLHSEPVVIISQAKYDEMVATIARLEAARAAQEASVVWEPVSDGEYAMQGFSGTYTLAVSHDGKELEAWSNAVDNQYKDGTPRDIEEIGIGEYRLCRHKPSEGDEANEN